MPSSLPEPRRAIDFSRELSETGWYHSFELPGGEIIRGYNRLEILRERYARLPIPPDLAGKRVLDIGAWDGWFSFEAERHGADVTAVDCWDVPNFRYVHRAIGSRVDYRVLDFYDLPDAGLGAFDYIFFLGILYHLKHPFLALEIVCALTADTAVVESFVTDADTWQEHRDEIPAMEFYETDELGNQLDNWNGPSVACLMAMCRAAGFARVELLYSKGLYAAVACYRKWDEPPVSADGEPPELIAVANPRTLGMNFASRKEQYVSCWFRAPRRQFTRADLRLEIAGFGVPALHVRPDQDGAWMASFRLPPGLTAGWKPVRLAFANSRFSRPLRIAVDVPLEVERLVVTGVCDGATWNPSEVTLADRGFVTCWVEGLPENADRHNVAAWLGDVKLAILYIGEPDSAGARQVNCAVPPTVSEGEQPFRIESGGARSDERLLKVSVGRP